MDDLERPGERLDGGDERGAARLAPPPVQLGAGDALRGQLFLGGGKPVGLLQAADFPTFVPANDPVPANDAK